MMVSEIKKKFLEKVRGPVFPIPTPFTEKGEVDYETLEKYVGFLLKEGARTLMVTIGTSRFDVLTVEEMKRINETVVNTANGNAVTIVTTPPRGPTFQAVAFAKHAEAAGADGILAVYPDRYYADEHVYAFFEEIAKSCAIGVLIHLVPLTPGRAGIGKKVHYSPDLVKRVAAVDNMVGMKEESHDEELVCEYNELFDGRFLVIGGAGGMQAHLNACKSGQPAYLVGIGSVFPEIELDFYAALVAGNPEEARQIASEREGPFFEAAIRLGWHLALKEALAVTGIMPPWERAPMSRLKPDDRQRIADALRAGALL